jgi:two-component system, LytTR family, response regulator
MDSRVVKTLIVDDERIARQVLREELEVLPGVAVVGEAEDGREALRKIVELQPDLVLLDLQMPLMGGFEVVRHLSGSRLPAVVIVTAFDQHAIEAFDAGAVDYLLKPVCAPRLHKAVERAKALLGKPLEAAENLARIASTELVPGSFAARKLVGRKGRDYFLLDSEEVLAFQAEGELVWIVTAKRRFLATQTLRAIEAKLQPSSFQRVHRNAIVNINHVAKMSAITSHRWMLTLSNQSEVVVSKRQAHNMRRLLQR